MLDLTIIIPHYNSPGYLKTLLDSIPLYENIQVIIVDDKSDKSTDIYQEVKTNREYRQVLFFDNTTDAKNAGACRNIGLKHAQGKWVLFADADDFFTDGFYDIIKKYFDSSYDVVFFLPTSVDRDTMKPAGRHLFIERVIKDYCKSPTPDNELRLRYKIAPPWSKMIRNELIQKHQITFSEIMVSNDILFSTKVGVFMKSFFVSEETIYCTTNTHGSLSKVMSEQYYDIKLNEFIRRYSFLKEHISKKEFKTLGLCGALQLRGVIKRKFGLKKFFSVMRVLRKNKIKLITSKYLRPLFLVNGLRIKNRNNRNNVRFLVEE